MFVQKRVFHKFGMKTNHTVEYYPPNVGTFFDADLYAIYKVLEQFAQNK